MRDFSHIQILYSSGNLIFVPKKAYKYFISSKTPKITEKNEHSLFQLQRNHKCSLYVIKVMDNLNQLEQDIMDVQGNTDGLENRTAEIEQDVFELEDNLANLSKYFQASLVNFRHKYVMKITNFQNRKERV